MDITPHDLRNAELREAFRGYRPDEVEELLERAAVALERMHERNRQLMDKLNAAVVRIVKEPAMNRFLSEQGADPYTTTAAEYAAYIKSEVAKWAKAVKDSGARVD